MRPEGGCSASFSWRRGIASYTTGVILQSIAKQAGVHTKLRSLQRILRFFRSQWSCGLRQSGGPDTASVSAEIAFLAFWDGNGRISRAVGAWVLLRAGYELGFDLRIYCRQRTDAYYRALA